MKFVLHSPFSHVELCSNADSSLVKTERQRKNAGYVQDLWRYGRGTESLTEQFANLPSSSVSPRDKLFFFFTILLQSYIFLISVQEAAHLGFGLLDENACIRGSVASLGKVAYK